MKKSKKLLALSLAVCMTAANVGMLPTGLSVVSAARSVKEAAQEMDTDTVSEAAESDVQNKIAAVNANGEVDMDALKANAAYVKEYTEDQQTFDGQRVDSETDAAMFDKVHKVNTGSIILRFKVDPECGNNGVLFAAKDKTIAGNLGTGTDCTTMYILNKNQFRFAYKHTVASLAGPYSFTDGNWHSIIITSLPTGKAMRLTIDGREMWSNSDNANRGMFTKHGVLDQLTIGGYLGADGTTKSNGFKGAISQIIVTDEIITDEQAIAITRDGYSGEIPMGSNLATLFNNAGQDTGDNSWVFTGGEAVWGPFDQLGGARNYMGHFEEYIRNQKTRGDDPTRQRYTINTAKEGQTLADIIADWNKKVTIYKPKAVAYMVGVEDYKLGTDHVDAFKASLKQFIDKALAEKPNNGGFAVIQKPFAVKDAETNAKIGAYCTAVDEVVAAYKSDIAKYNNIAVIDHYTQTKDNADFKTNKLNADGSLNEAGHLEIGRQLVEGTITTDASNSYPCKQGVRMGQTPVQQGITYVNQMPSVTATDTSLAVTLPQGIGTAWKYALDIDGIIISDTVSGTSFTISDLPTGKSYVLKVQSSDGTKQLTTTKGVVEAGNVAVKNVQELDANQQRLADMMKAKDSMTWLFMGDSITHALVYTYGYAGTAQTVEKYLRDGLGRKDDVVINTAVSGAWTVSTLNNIEQRLEKYVPDVVSIMLGTNDAYYNPQTGMTVTADQYETNLRDIISRIKKINKDAIIVLRCPTPMTNTDGSADSDGNTRKQRALINTERMKKVVAEDPSIIYVDQFTEMNDALSTYTWLGSGNQNFLGNWLHPGINGQQMMAKQFMKGCGIYTDDSAISNLYYKQPIAKTDSQVTPKLNAAANQIAVSAQKLTTDSSMQIGSVTVKATAKDGTKSYETTAEAGKANAILKNLPAGIYTVTVSSMLKNEAKTVTFASQDITLSTDDTVTFDVFLSSKKAKELAKGSVVGTLSVDETAPEGDYTYTLCTGEGSDNNDSFEIAGSELKVKKALTEGETYAIRVKAENGTYSKEETFSIYAVGKGLVFEKSDVAITSGAPDNLSGETYADRLMKMDEGSIVVEFTSTSNYLIQSLFSVANGGTAAGDSNRHFHLYVTPKGALGTEIRNNDAFGFVTADGMFTHGEKNKVAIKADKENKQYKFFVNGELVKTVDASNYRFVSDITGVNTAEIGATKRGNEQGYPFGGTIHNIKVYETALSDDELKAATSNTAAPELDKEALTARIAELKAVDKSNKTTDSAEAFDALIATAEHVLATAETQEQLNAQLTALQNAESVLVARGNVDALQKLIAQYAGLKEEDFTAATWKAYQAALDEAKAAVADNSNLDQAAVDALEEALTKAKEELEEAEEPGEPEEDTTAPTTPTELKAVKVEETSVQITWKASEDNVGVVGYEVFLDGKLLGTVEKNEAVVKDLTSDQTYRIMVRAFDQAGNHSDFSEVLEVRTKKAPNDSDAGTDPTEEAPTLKPVPPTGDTSAAGMMLLVMALASGVVLAVRRRRA